MESGIWPENARSLEPRIQTKPTPISPGKIIDRKEDHLEKDTSRITNKEAKVVLLAAIITRALVIIAAMRILAAKINATTTSHIKIAAPVMTTMEGMALKTTLRVILTKISLILVIITPLK